MSKIKFSKVEDALAKVILDISVNCLVDLADVAASIGQPPTEFRKLPAMAYNPNTLNIERLKKELIWFHTHIDRALYLKLGTKAVEIRALYEKEKLTDDEIEFFRQIKEKFEKYKEEHKKQLPEDYDEKIVEQEIKRHINKRFNISERWLPIE